MLLRAYSTLKLASLGNFDFYAEGFRAIARALPKLEETWQWRCAMCHELPMVLACPKIGREAPKVANL